MPRAEEAAEDKELTVRVGVKIWYSYFEKLAVSYEANNRFAT